jgi:hypothetical protein
MPGQPPLAACYGPLHRGLGASRVSVNANANTNPNPNNAGADDSGTICPRARPAKITLLVLIISDTPYPDDLHAPVRSSVFDQQKLA